MHRSMRKMLGSLVAMLLVAGGLAAVAVAASTVVVTPTHTQGWSTADTRPGGTVSYVNDATAPGGSALQLTTDSTNAAKAQYMHATDTPLSSVSELRYSTKQVSGPPVADPAYQLPVCLNGTSAGCAGFTTLVYEPYYNGTVTPGIWQSWNVADGLFWSSKTITCSNGTILGAPGGPPAYTLAAIETICPEAVVAGFGVNIGTYNPDYNVEADLVNFNGTTYDFQTTNPPATASDCKKGGWNNLTDGSGAPFKNQGDCESYYQQTHNHGHTK